MEYQAKQTGMQQEVQQDEEVKLMDLLLVIAKHNRFILKLTLGAAVLAVVVSLLLPNIYTAKTVIMPPQQQGASTANMLLGQLGGLAGVAGGAMGIKNPSDLYVGMLKSRTVADALILRFNLMKMYEAKTMTAARRMLEAATAVTAGKDGFIVIEFSDKDPKLAASIANAYIEELDKLARSHTVKDAEGRKLFYEKQLGDVRDKLTKAELEMREFQEKNRIFRLTGNIASSGMGGNGIPSGIAGIALGASGEIPKAELDFMRIAREVKFQEMLLGSMAQQVTSATIDAAKDFAVIQVLDKAVVPEKKSKPMRALIVLLVTFFALLIGLGWAFIMDASERARKNPAQAERVNLFRSYLRLGNKE